MEYTRILSELDNTKWLITNDALDGIYKAVEYGITNDDRILFHKAEDGAFSLVSKDKGRKKPIMKGSTGFIMLDGPIVPRETSFTKASDLTSIEKLTREFKTFSADDTVKDIVFLIDSPGGAVTGVSEFAQLVAKCDKHTTAFVLGQAASAAYWIASAADKIVSVDTGIVGSIGVVLRRVDKEDGVKEIVSTQSPNKRPDMDTKKGKAVIQEQIDDIADVMIGFIGEQRGVTSDFVIENFGRGATMIASKALKAGMIDGISTLDNFINGISAEQHEDKIKASTNETLVETHNQDKNSITKPANAGEGEQQMKLKDFLAENPAAKAEYENALLDARDAGAKSVTDRMDALKPFMDSDAYPKQMQKLALECLNGDVGIEAVKTAATIFDALDEQQKQADAKDESLETKETPTEIKTGKNDGIVSTESEITAAMNEIIAFEGGEVING